MKRECKDWTLACSRSRARILRGNGPMSAPRAQELALRARQDNLRALIRGSGHAMDGADVTASGARLHADDLAFSAEIAALLDVHRSAGDLDRLIVIAPGPMLAVLRTSFSPALRRIVVAECERDMVGLDAATLHRFVAGLWREVAPG